MCVYVMRVCVCVMCVWCDVCVYDACVYIYMHVYIYVYVCIYNLLLQCYRGMLPH